MYRHHKGALAIDTVEQNSTMFARIWRYFAYLGTFATSIVAIVTMLQMLPAGLIAGTFMERGMAVIASWVAPPGYQVRPAFVDVVEPGEGGEAFELKINSIVDLRIDGKIYPFTVNKLDTLGRAGFSLQGGWQQVSWGSRKNIKGTDCYIQLARKPNDSSETSIAILKFYCGG